MTTRSRSVPYNLRSVHNSARALHTVQADIFRGTQDDLKEHKYLRAYAQKHFITTKFPVYRIGACQYMPALASVNSPAPWSPRRQRGARTELRVLSNRPAGRGAEQR